MNIKKSLLILLSALVLCCSLTDASHFIDMEIHIKNSDSRSLESFKQDLTVYLKGKGLKNFEFRIKDRFVGNKQGRQLTMLVKSNRPPKGESFY